MHATSLQNASRARNRVRRIQHTSFLLFLECLVPRATNAHRTGAEFAKDEERVREIAGVSSEKWD